VLGPLANEFFGRPSHSLNVAAVTGTNGKTTTTYLLESIARAAGVTPGVVGTVSRRFAGIEEPAPMNTPEAVDLHRLLRRMLDAGVRFVALEASSDGLAQDRLRATRVTSAGFTNLTQDHLNTHGSMEAYFEAKTMLFDTAYTQKAVINVGDEWGRSLYERVRSSLDVWTYGAPSADLTAVDADLGPAGTTATVQTPAGSIAIATALVGRYNLSNCMCAAGMALQCGFSLAETATGIEQLRVAPGRLESVDEGQGFLALVDYAHTPDALEQAIGACRELASNRLVVVFGCGGDRDRTKRPLMGQAATRGADVTIVTSDNPRSEDPARIIADIRPGARRGGGEFVEIADRREAITHAVAIARDGDVVLIAGKGHEQGQKFADRTIPFDDRDVVRDALRGAACRS
jgi:UDP-N-acetylmuramoyl-L-alanyl-D-glutamate--2,6-diaminopimelate ligase